MNKIIFRRLIVLGISFGILTPLAYGQGTARTNQNISSRLSQLVEANIVATHAYQILLAEKSAKADKGCYGPGKLSDGELEALVEHQRKLLKSDLTAVKTWSRGGQSNFDPTQDLEPILASGLTLSPTVPVNVFTDYLREHTKADIVQIRDR